MGIMDSSDIRYIWAAIRESERNDEELSPKTEETVQPQRAITTHNQHIVYKMGAGIGLTQSSVRPAAASLS